MTAARRCVIDADRDRRNHAVRDAAAPLPDNATEILDAYAEHLRVRRLSANTVKVRLIVAGEVMTLGDPLRVTSVDLTGLVTERWSRLAPNTHRHYVQHAHDFFDWLHRSGQRVDNPSHGLVRPRVPKRAPHPISEVDLERALAEAPQPLRVWIALGAYAGLRCCEIASLAVDDITVGDEASIAVVGKGDKQRVIPVGRQLVAEIAAYPARPATGPLFRRLDGRPVMADQVSARIGSYLRRIGIDETAHSLRHRYATRLYKSTGDIVMVGALLGHASIATTQIYTAWSRPGARRAVDALSVALEQSLDRPAPRASTATTLTERDDATQAVLRKLAALLTE